MFAESRYGVNLCWINMAQAAKQALNEAGERQIAAMAKTRMMRSERNAFPGQTEPFTAVADR
jgi:hypothetical protein